MCQQRKLDQVLALSAQRPPFSGAAHTENHAALEARRVRCNGLVGRPDVLFLVANIALKLRH